MQIKYKDVEKEKEFLAILLKAKRLNKHEIINQVNPSTFTTKAAQETFKLIRDYVAKYFAPINAQIAKSLVDGLDGPVRTKTANFVKAIARLKPNIKTVHYLVEELLFHEACRDAQKMLLTAKDIFKQNGNPFMVRDFLFDAITQSKIKQGSGVDILDFRRDFKDRFKYIKEAKKSGERYRGIPSGIDDRFDDETSGYCPGDLVIFVAQTAGGKSICMQDQAAYMVAELNKKIAIVTNEMTARQVAFRIDSRISEVRHKKFKKPILMRQLDLERWKISVKQLVKKDRLCIMGMTGGNCSAAAIDQKLQEKGFKPDVIFIDYVNNMVPSSMPARESLSLDWQPQGQILRDCKNLGLKRKVPILSAGQLKPEAYDKDEIVPSDIAINKQALLTNADVLVAIVQTRAMRQLNPPRARIQFMKVREGKTREYIEVIPDFGIIRVNNPKKRRKKKKRKRK